MKDWHLRFAANMLDYQGYSIGKLLGLINDPAIISLAGGLLSPDMFLRTELQMATRQRLEYDIDRIMQYSPVRGETELIDAVIAFLERDGIRVAPDNILHTHFLSDQATSLCFIKKLAKYGSYPVLGCTFQGQKHGCKDFGVP